MAQRIVPKPPVRRSGSQSAAAATSRGPAPAPGPNLQVRSAPVDVATPPRVLGKRREVVFAPAAPPARPIPAAPPPRAAPEAALPKPVPAPAPAPAAADLAARANGKRVARCRQRGRWVTKGREVLAGREAEMVAGFIEANGGQAWPWQRDVHKAFAARFGLSNVVAREYLAALRRTLRLPGLTGDRDGSLLMPPAWSAQAQASGDWGVFAPLRPGGC